MKLKCPQCGGGRFRARQYLRGAIDVIVDEQGQWIANDTQDGRVDESGLDFDKPEGPYECVGCGEEAEWTEDYPNERSA